MAAGGPNAFVYMAFAIYYFPSLLLRSGLLDYSCITEAWIAKLLRILLYMLKAHLDDMHVRYPISTRPERIAHAILALHNGACSTTASSHRVEEHRSLHLPVGYRSGSV